MATKTEDVRAISKIAGILAELERDDRCEVMKFVDTNSTAFVGRTKAALRVASVLQPLDAAALDRVIVFFRSQLEPQDSANA